MPKAVRPARSVLAASDPALCTPPSTIIRMERRDIGVTIRPRSRRLASYVRRMLKHLG